MGIVLHNGGTASANEDEHTVASKNVTFLYTLRDGHASGSFATNCARLAGMPEATLHRIEEILSCAEEQKPVHKMIGGEERERTRLNASLFTWLQSLPSDACNDATNILTSVRDAHLQQLKSSWHS